MERARASESDGCRFGHLLMYSLGLWPKVSYLSSLSLGFFIRHTEGEDASLTGFLGNMSYVPTSVVHSRHSEIVGILITLS